jgi:hypothetical protein
MTSGCASAPLHTAKTWPGCETTVMFPRLLIDRDILITISTAMCTSANSPANLDTIFTRNQATRACYTHGKRAWSTTLVVVQPCAFPTRDATPDQDPGRLDPATRNAHIYTRTNHSLEQLLQWSTPPNSGPEFLSHARRACLIAPKVVFIQAPSLGVYPRLCKGLVPLAQRATAVGRPFSPPGLETQIWASVLVILHFAAAILLTACHVLP